MNLAVWRRILGALEREDFSGGDSLSDRIVQARAYVDQRLYRADVVVSLPPDAPAGYLLVTPGDSHLYVGAGQGNPLRSIPTQPLP